MYSKNRSNRKITDYRSYKYYREQYGKDVIVTHLGHVNIVHLDHQDKEEIQKRKEEIMREELTGESLFSILQLIAANRSH